MGRKYSQQTYSLTPEEIRICTDIALIERRQDTTESEYLGKYTKETIIYTYINFTAIALTKVPFVKVIWFTNTRKVGLIQVAKYMKSITGSWEKLSYKANRDQLLDKLLDAEELITKLENADK